MNTTESQLGVTSTSFDIAFANKSRNLCPDLQQRNSSCPTAVLPLEEGESSGLVNVSSTEMCETLTIQTRKKERN